MSALFAFSMVTSIGSYKIVNKCTERRRLKVDRFIRTRFIVTQVRIRRVSQQPDKSHTGPCSPFPKAQKLS